MDPSQLFERKNEKTPRSGDSLNLSHPTKTSRCKQKGSPDLRPVLDGFGEFATWRRQTVPLGVQCSESGNGYSGRSHSSKCVNYFGFFTFPRSARRADDAAGLGAAFDRRTE